MKPGKLIPPPKATAAVAALAALTFTPAAGAQSSAPECEGYGGPGLRQMIRTHACRLAHNVDGSPAYFVITTKIRRPGLAVAPDGLVYVTVTAVRNRDDGVRERATWPMIFNGDGSVHTPVRCLPYVTWSHVRPSAQERLYITQVGAGGACPPLLGPLSPRPSLLALNPRPLWRGAQDPHLRGLPVLGQRGMRLPPADNRRIDRLVARRCARPGTTPVITPRPDQPAGNGAVQWSRRVTWIDRPEGETVTGLVTPGRTPVVTSSGRFCR
ncbi:MAG TPA: hypothetical protein VN213_22085 [Solirubrobacteraceae bacterium]|nr:hypothetical protein [Solirubrobacteraceae bacterium]